MKEIVRVLHVLGSLSLGGAESRIMDLYRSIDREKLQFDFLVHSSEEEYFDKEIKSLGGNVYRIPRFKVYNWLEYRKALKKFFSKHREFRAVHGHMTSTAAIYLPIAKKSGVPVTIAHARSAGVADGIKGLLTRIIRYPLKYRADYCLACSREAGEAVYGKKWMREGKAEVVPNAIDAGKYAYDENVRNAMRKEYQLEGKLVIGHVGSFRTPKNHDFLIRIFSEIYKRRKDAVLILLGEGALMENIRAQAAGLGLEGAVRFFGNQTNVSSYYQMFDYLVFPSLYEGLPGTVVEAQTAGLRCLVSDTVTREAGITELAEFYGLDKTAEEWADYVLERCMYERRSRLSEVEEAGFGIKSQIERYQRIYGKNILLMVPLLHQGGFERICAMTAHLIKDACNVSIAVFSTQDMFYDVSGIELHDLDLGSRPGIPGKILNVLRRRRKIKKLKRKNNIHVTYSFGPTANLVNALSKENDEVWIGIRGYGELENRASMRFVCGRADKVICCTQVMADDVETMYRPRQVECLYNPCNVNEIRELCGAQPDAAYAPFFEENGQIIASMSREDDVKGFWHLIKAFALIKGEIPEAKLMIIGEGEFAEYKKLAADLGISESVLFTGVQHNPFCYLSRAALYIMTSITEGFPNSLIEAMAAGVPAMSVNCKTGPAEIFMEDYRSADDQHKVYRGDYGILLPVLNPDKNTEASVIEEEERILAAEAVKVLSDAGRLDEMRKASKYRSGSFSIEKYKEQFLKSVLR